MSKSCLIIGGGIAGLSAALSLSQIGIQCTIYELRTTPATIGGAIHLAPNALRLFESLDVELFGCRVDSIEIFSLHTGGRLGELPFRKFGSGLRILREELLQALLRAIGKKKIPVVYGSKLVAIEDRVGDEKVTAMFANGKEVQANFILGCDGIHSAVRMQCVEPGRTPVYTEVAVAYSVIDGTGIKTHFHQTAMSAGRFGSLLMSYIDPERTEIYLAAVMEFSEQNDKQGWRARGDDRQKTLAEVQRRCKDSAIQCVSELVERADDFIFYPVYTLGPGGIWSQGRVLLLGDAAHGVGFAPFNERGPLISVQMPPQGESTGLAAEDGVLLARVLSSFPEMSIQEAFQVYENTRRPRIDIAYKEAVFRWEGVKDRRWFMQKVIEWLMWAFLWYKTRDHESSMAYDIRKEEITERLPKQH